MTASFNRTVDMAGQTIDFLLTEQHDKRTAKCFLTKAIRRHGMEEHGTAITIRNHEYLDNVVEPDYRAVMHVTRPLLGLKSFDAAQAVRVGIELPHRIKERQMVVGTGEESLTAAELFYPLAAESPPQTGTTVSFHSPSSTFLINKKGRLFFLYFDVAGFNLTLKNSVCHYPAHQKTTAFTPLCSRAPTVNIPGAGL